MSGKATGLCWEADLPRPEKYVLLAMADHADHLGRNMRPSQRLISWKTGYTERHIRDIQKKLVNTGVLIRTKESNQHQPATYDISWEDLPRLDDNYAREEEISGLARGEEISGLNGQTGNLEPQTGNLEAPDRNSGLPPNGEPLTGLRNGRNNQTQSWDDVLAALGLELPGFIFTQHFSQVAGAWDASNGRWLIHIPDPQSRAFVGARVTKQLDKATAPASWLLVDEADELDIGRPTAQPALALGGEGSTTAATEAATEGEA